jgi:NitT/TauT family transport system substrate-binding protein
MAEVAWGDMMAGLRRIVTTFLLLGMASPAAAADHIKFLTDSFLIGATAPYLYAKEQGFYAARGIDIDIEPSAGSGDCIAKIAAGSADAGYADISTLIDFASQHPDQAPVAVMIVQDQSAQSIVSYKSAGIEKPADLLGKRIGTAQLDATSRMFPLFAKLNHLPWDQLNRIPVDQQLRDMLLAKGDFDAAIGFDYSIIFKLVSLNHPLSDINVMHYRDYGLDLYGNAILVSQSLLREHPEVVRGLVAASTIGWIRGEQDRDGVIAALVKRDALMQPKPERARLDWALDTLILTDWVRAHGLGSTDPDRLQRNLELVVTGFGLANKPPLASIVSQAFLPPAAERQFH